MKQNLAVACTLALGSLLIGAASPALAAEPAPVVDGLHASLLSGMKNGARLGCGGRIAALEPVVDKSFDLSFIASRVLRKSWSGLSAAQQHDFLAVFRDFVVDNYAANFKAYDGESFATLGEDPMSGGLREIRSQLKTGSGATHEFDYVFKQGPDGGWRIVNVISDGVSNLALWTTQYDGLMQSQGFDALLARMREQAAKIKAAC